MPGLNGTGPMGLGSGTGRGLGRCNPENNTTKFEDAPYAGKGPGACRGRGRGYGRGINGGQGFRRYWNHNKPTSDSKEVNT